MCYGWLSDAGSALHKAPFVSRRTICGTAEVGTIESDWTLFSQAVRTIRSAQPQCDNNLPNPVNNYGAKP
jgi:hypothetical protein